MWNIAGQVRKWRADSLEARIYAAAEALALANDADASRAADDAMEAVFQVMGWLSSTKRQADVVEMVKDQFGVETSPAGLSGFYSRLCSSWAGERMRRNARGAAAIANVISPEEEKQIKSAFWLDLRQRAFELMTNPNPDPKDYVEFAKVILQKDGQDMDRDKFGAAMKTKIELGLDEVAKAIKGNKEAERLYNLFREVVTKA